MIPLSKIKANVAGWRAPNRFGSWHSGVCFDFEVLKLIYEIGLPMLKPGSKLEVFEMVKSLHV